jgi:hypothetical protein
VVGTGGNGRYGFGRILETSEARISDTYGVLVLTLRRTSYDWAFVPVRSQLDRNGERTSADSGSADCH